MLVIGSPAAVVEVSVDSDTNNTDGGSPCYQHEQQWGQHFVANTTSTDTDGNVDDHAQKAKQIHRALTGVQCKQ